MLAKRLSQSYRVVQKRAGSAAKTACTSRLQGNIDILAAFHASSGVSSDVALLVCGQKPVLFKTGKVCQVDRYGQMNS